MGGPYTAYLVEARANALRRARLYPLSSVFGRRLDRLEALRLGRLLREWRRRS